MFGRNLMTKCIAGLLGSITLLIAGCGSPDSESANKISAATLELRALEDEDTEAEIWIGAVDSSADFPFGCHLFLDLMPFTLRGERIEGASFSATQIRFGLPWDHEKPDGDLEQLDGAIFGNDDLAGRHRFEIINHGLVGLSSELPVTLDRLSLTRTDNWHFHADIRGRIALNEPPREIPVRISESLEIVYLHFPPHGAPDDEIIDSAKKPRGWHDFERSGRE